MTKLATLDSISLDSVTGGLRGIPEIPPAFQNDIRLWMEAMGRRQMTLPRR